MSLPRVPMEWAWPTPPRRKPKGIVIVLHGGGWVVTGQKGVDSIRPTAKMLNRWGFATLNMTYRPGKDGLDDVVAAYDFLKQWVREYFDGKLPISALGHSAGGHWALMLASKRKPHAVIGCGAPVDLADHDDHSSQAQYLRRCSVPAFGDKAAEFSPSRLELHGRVLVPISRADFVIPARQIDAFPAHLWLDAGSIPFVHAGLSVKAWAIFRRQAKRVLI